MTSLHRTFGKLSDFLYNRKKQYLPNGIPSHDTINRVFGLMNSCHFERLFIDWTKSLKDDNLVEKVISNNGKTVRGSKEFFFNDHEFHSRLFLLNSFGTLRGEK